ncbi:galectin-8-like isoform X1 [Solea senegalensis]|uniref:Galectin n=1 Tax=Solea senegalensis TaxID=28829 RepID=A0AAV6RTW0_SOLSE|nr:galectin-8-like [Solea senegalensis]KAG7508078.1 galectin-8-like isoform X1 [Solea senegalensis]
MFVSSSRQTFLKPVIPFAGTILGGLCPGEMVLIQGSVPSDSDRFQVDFTCGSSMKPRADVAFHFNPRFRRSPCVVCNTLQKERWGREEILRQAPFTAGEAFELVVLVLRDEFKVAVNGAHLLQYKHRVALERIDTLCISGKVSVGAVGVVPPASISPAASPTNQDSERKAIISLSGNLLVPFTGNLSDGLKVGRSISIKAETNENARSFCVNLRPSDGGDIVLHLNPRLTVSAFIRNSFLRESWGIEEKTLDSFPFTAGQYFEMIVRCDSHFFRVAVNGTHLLDYKHRVQDLDRITVVEVQGDVRLLDVKIF